MTARMSADDATSSLQSAMDSASLEFMEGLYDDYLRDPEAVAPEWRRYFDRFDRNGHHPIEESVFPRLSLFRRGGVTASVGASSGVVTDVALQERVDRMVDAYRTRGHIVAQVDPLNRPVPETPELTLEFYGLTENDLDRPVALATVEGTRVQTVRRVLDLMRSTYCRFIGVQFRHIDELSVRRWLQLRMESTGNRLELSREEQLRILTRLTDAVVFEQFIQKKYVGAKSFSLEGAESLIPLLDLLIEKAGNEGTQEIVLGMAHRGRLNVLANIVGKKYRAIFREFDDVDGEYYMGHGDVKYHLGHSNDWKTSSGNVVHLSLCFNPSHLEFINPVALGRMRAKQDRFGDSGHRRGLTLLIHGDAAFAGEGIVQETLNLSALPHYRVGGTIHVIVNNQIGFTTGPALGRSSPYATDVARMLQIPIFHVNGEDPESVAQVVRLALDFRNKFQRDAVIDMYCYRRHGHSEGDEPGFTQPVMYKTIESRPTVGKNYLARLLESKQITAEEADQIEAERRELLEQELAAARSKDYVPAPAVPVGVWKGYTGGSVDQVEDVDTGVPLERLTGILTTQTKLPPDFTPHPKIVRWVQARGEMAAGKRGLDWAAGEALAFGSLLLEGKRVRLSGQDCVRGTFSQRHSALYDVTDGHPHRLFTNLALDQGPVEIINSPLSEAGVLGFEYGYSLDWPDGLVMWEAQFGDFVNAAQVIIDQFISSAEDKWRRLSGLVMLLPHGFEGQGPEHSSARLERFLTLAAEDNIQVVCPTTPAQYFHVLRRQVVRPLRKPLVVMTPKSLLRHAAAVSSLSELTQGTFQSVLPDREFAPAQIRRILLCTGKVFYDLHQRREELNRKDVAIVRLEQLYPLQAEALRSVLASYKDGTPAVWVQEEPANMGAWTYLRALWGDTVFGRLPFSGVSRPASASPATGSASSHKLEQSRLLDQAFGGAER